MKFFDVIIIGGGAAGLMCASVAKKRGRKVLLIDHAESVGKKIRISGGGRCNFTNIHNSPKNFLSANPHFCVSALKRYTAQDFINLVKKHKISFHEKTLGQLFCDGSSQAIIDMLLAECRDEDPEKKVEIWLNTTVEEIVKNGEDGKGNFTLKTSREVLRCESVVIATGGPSIPKMGATDFGYKIARQFGVKIIEATPALVPLTFEEELLNKTKLLSGVALDAVVSIDRVKFEEAVLFTHRGISGPAILQISSYWKKGQKITINFAPQVDIFLHMQTEKKSNPKQEIQAVLSKILPRSFVKFALDETNRGFRDCGAGAVAPSFNVIFGSLADLANQKIKELASFINSWSVIPKDTEGFAKAEVTLGGIDTNEISSKTFEAKSVPGLFFIGEVLDVTGHLGGHNFQWAWASGHAAGEWV